MDPSFIEDTDHRTAWREKIKPHIDETTVSRKEVDTERIIVLKSDTTQTEEPERQIYPKEQDIGRIVIEEISEERLQSKYLGQPKSTDVTITTEHVTDTSRPSEIYDDYNVAKLDLRKLDSREVESRSTTRLMNEKEWVERQRKACLNYVHGSMEISYQKI